MARYLAGRIAGLVLILFTVCLFTYLIFFKLSPDPALMICGKTCTPERVTEIRAVLGIDQPFLTQFWDFLSGLITGRDYETGARESVAANVAENANRRGEELPGFRGFRGIERRRQGRPQREGEQPGAPTTGAAAHPLAYIIPN